MIKSMGEQHTHTGQNLHVTEFCRNPGTCDIHMTCDLQYITVFSLNGLEGDEGWCMTLDRTALVDRRKSCGMYSLHF